MQHLLVWLVSVIAVVAAVVLLVCEGLMDKRWQYVFWENHRTGQSRKCRKGPILTFLCWIRTQGRPIRIILFLLCMPIGICVSVLAAPFVAIAGMLAPRRIRSWVEAGSLPPTFQRVTTQTKCINLLNTWALLLPVRIANEDLADYLEVIHKLKADGTPNWKIYLRTITAIFWTGINAAGFLLKALGRTKSTG